MATDRKVAVVTGASRGAGRGIAHAFGAKGWRVYVTGRTLKEGDAGLPGTIGSAAQQVTDAGGEGIAVRVDHAQRADVAALFARVREESGRLDVLVSNATAIHDDLVKPENFWEKSLDLVNILNVGLMSHYIAAWHAAKIMVPQKNGLIAFTSSPGAICYMHGAAYGAGKAGTDKMAHDMGVDLDGTGVAALSMWMGVLRTERTMQTAAEHQDQYGALLANAETPEFQGYVLHAIYEDRERARLNGSTVISAEMAEHYGIADEGGRHPVSHRGMIGAPVTWSNVVIR